jgi:hypothetical protein
MTQLASLKSSLGPELWFLVVAFLAGAVVRLLKRWLPASYLPGASAIVGALLSGGAAVALREPVVGALLLGATAGTVSVGGHELAKKLLSRFLGVELAERMLGIARKPDAPNVDRLRKAGVFFVFLTACLPPAMPTPRFEACKARYDACVKDSATRSEYDECRDVVNTDCLDAPAPAASASAVSP